MTKKIRLVSFYLPQYHPIPENDAWWGKGFTEWTNVTKAKPLFHGHYQPHLPSDLGFYDLRLPEARQAQADLAQEYGIHGFCYYHYWFGGQRLLERPFNEVLNLGQPDLPFCLCWANGSWNRAWDGQETQLLIQQQYSDQDDITHIHWLAQAFRDNRYIKIDGKPVFLVYQAYQLPNPQRTTHIWRQEAQKLGIGELFLIKVDSFQDKRIPPKDMGFDAALEFQPDTAKLLTFWDRLYWNIRRRLNIQAGSLICNYPTWVKRALNQPPRPYKYFPCITPSWDNSARRHKGAFIFHNANPQSYQYWLEATLEKFTPYSPDENFVFINAWNEWAEGNHLEPCQKWGRAYLEATLKAIQPYR